MKILWSEEAWDDYLYWQTQIDEKNRLIYRIIEDRIEIVLCGGHYDDR